MLTNQLGAALHRLLTALTPDQVCSTGRMAPRSPLDDSLGRLKSLGAYGAPHH
jgi:hypothetical protein